MERWLRKFFYNENGAVSLYLIIITLAIFIFNAVLIDYARIHVAQNQTEKAMQAAARSTMSSYHNSVQNYGLFVFNGDEDKASEIFQEVFEHNLTLSPEEYKNKKDYFQFVDTRIEGEPNLTFEANRMLINIDVMEHQVLEEMKYRAPVEFTEEIIKGILSISESMKEASAFSEIVKKIKPHYDTREARLDKVKQYLNDAKKKLDLEKEIRENRLAEGLKYPEVRNLADIVAYFYYEGEIKGYRDDLSTKKEELKEEQDKDDPDEDKIEELEKEIEELEKDIDEHDDQRDEFWNNADSLFNKIRKDLADATDYIEDALRELEEAQQLNNKIKEIIENERANAGSNYDNASAHAVQEPSSEASEAANTMQESRENLDQYIMEDQFFTDLSKKIEKARDEVGTQDVGFENIPTRPVIEEVMPLREYMKYYRLLVNAIKDISLVDMKVIKQIEERRQAEEKRKEAEDLVKDAISYFDKNRKEFKAETNEDYEAEAKTALDEVLKIFSQLTRAAEDWTDDVNTYEELEEILGEFEVFEEDEILDFDTEGVDPFDAAASMMDIVDVIFKEIGDALVGGRNHIYINEYVLTRFESKEPRGLQNRDEFLFKNREVEYIMYGIDKPVANYATAIAQLIALRFALNFIMAFTKEHVRFAGHPLLVFAVAVLDAFIQTGLDMKNLLKIGGNSDEVPFLHLTRKTGENPIPSLDYKQYLRLFMFTNPGRENRMKRALAVIQKKESDVDFTEQSSYVKVNAETSVRLWFLPQVAETLGRAGVINGRVEGNRFYIEKEMHYSY